MNWSILLLLAVVPPLFAAVVFGVYKLATAKHLGFWLLTILWSVAIVTWAVLGGGLVLANRDGHVAGLPRQFWQEWFAAAVVFVGGLLTMLTLVRGLILALVWRGRPVEPPPPVAVSVARRADSQPPVAEGLGRFAGWTAAVVGFFIAWVWCISRFQQGEADEVTMAVFVALGLLILAVVADFVRGMLTAGSRASRGGGTSSARRAARTPAGC